MGRTLVLLAIGIAVGAAGTYYIVSPIRRAGTAPSLQRPAQPFSTPAAFEPIDAADAPSVAERRAVYDIASQADAATLETRLTDAAGAPASSTKQFTLGVLLARYAEIDPARAVRFARRLGLEAALWLPAYEAWAARDPSAAMQGLGDLADPADARAAGLAVLRGLGGSDVRGVRRVVAALPADVRQPFLDDAVAAIAQSSPADALDLALALEDRNAVGPAVRSVAEAWAERDPQAALAAADSIGDAALSAWFRDAVLSEWARSDPERVLAYVGTADAATQQRLLRTVLLPNLAQIEPERVLELTDDHPSAITRFLRQQAVQQLAGRDPAAALAYAQGLPPGQQRRILLLGIARGYGQTQPDAALAWARNLQPPDPQVLAGVLGGIARTDPDRALELALTESSPVAQQRAIISIVGGATADSRQTARMAERLFSQPPGGAASGAIQSALQMLTQRWAAEDSAGALDWMLAHTDRVGARAFAQVAQQLAQQDPTTAALYTAQIPKQARDQWITAVAGSYAQYDAQGALAWIAQFRGQPEYDAAASAVAQHLAQFDPQAAASLVQNVEHPSNATFNAAAGVALQMAQSNPRGASQWAFSLKDAQTRQAALRAVVQRWAAEDAESAQSWTLSLPRGEKRDAALGQLLAAVARSRTPDRNLLAAFSDDRVRQWAARNAAFAIAQRDADEARAFADAYITDPQLRRTAQQMIEQAPRNSFTVGERSTVIP